MEEMLVRVCVRRGIIASLIWRWRHIAEDAVGESPRIRLPVGGSGVGLDAVHDGAGELAGHVELRSRVGDEENARVVSRCELCGRGGAYQLYLMVSGDVRV